MATTYFSIGENLGRDDFVGTKRLSRVDEGGEDFASLLDFALRDISVSNAHNVIDRQAGGGVHTAAGRGQRVVNS